MRNSNAPVKKQIGAYLDKDDLHKIRCEGKYGDPDKIFRMVLKKNELDNYGYRKDENEIKRKIQEIESKPSFIVQSNQLRGIQQTTE